MEPGLGARSNKSAKEVLDEFGQQVHDKVKKDAETYDSYLKGNLTDSTILGESAAFSDPCKLVEQYRSKADTKSERYPCGTRREEVKRFSDKQGAQCDKKKIKDSDSNGDACAPFRRLNLCNKNLETVSNYNSNARHKLLAEVCYAAKYEGDLIKTHHTKHEQTNHGFHTNICTVLARSFADIGDIVRGKDLFLGNDKEKKKRDELESKLKEIFGDIYKDLTKKKRKNAEDRYNDNDKNFFKLREDWWTANRATVWKALTCDDKLANASYFRATCNGKERTKGYCRCNDDKPGHDKPNTDPPTYFDYVPQYLRWFEEWAEDFCRKKKKKVENLQKQCRGKYQDADRYCSRNGCDCEQTVNARGKLRYGNRCIDCLYACNPYVEWIEKQKEQFDKQVKKYTSEMQKYTKVASGNRGRLRRSARGTSTTNYDGYESKFYDELQSNGYGSVDEFLEKLSNEEICTKNTEIKEGGKINFEKVNSGKHSSGGDSGTNDINNGTFYRSEYCQPCPPCGVERNGSGWKDKKNGKCTSGNLYTISNNAESTDINVLSFGDKREDIRKKIDTFCQTPNGNSGKASSSGSGGKNSNNQELYEEWKCYEAKHVKKVKNGEDDDDDVSEVRNAGGLCILPNPKKNEKHESGKNSSNEPEQLQKTYNDFFYYWVAHMLKDSIYWRTKRLRKCINNTNESKACKNNDKCKTDCGCFERWVKQKKQQEWDKIKKHFKTQNIGQETDCDPIVTLELVLQIEFLKDESTDDSEENSKNSLDAEEAKELKHLRQMLQQADVPIGDAALAAFAVSCAQGTVAEQDTIMDKLLNLEEKEAEKCKNCDKKPPAGEEGGVARSDSGSQPPATGDNGHHSEDSEEEEEDEDEVEEDEEIEEVKEKTEEKKEEDNGGGGDDVHQDGAEEPVEETVAEVTDTSVDVCTTVAKALADTESLQEACTLKYVTAVETFFLWDRYKKLNTKKPQGGSSLGGAAAQLQLQLQQPDSGSDDSDPDPQTQLASGNIPIDFLRQMFYTLGDYKDICTGDEKVIQMLKASGDKNIDTINKKIKTILNGDTSPSKPSVTTPQALWSKYAEPIWNGMVCALTYKDNTNGGEDTKKVVKDTTVESTLIKDGKPNPPNDYNSVTLKDENSGTDRPKPTPQTASTTGGDTHLSKFVLRPPYFRYLEEWGQNFCKERKKRLKEVKKACRVTSSGNPTFCSGDGHICTEKKRSYNNMFDDLDCPDCYEQCRKYRKWIDIKFEEFQKQKDKYKGERVKVITPSTNGGDDNKKFCDQIEKKNTAADFLAALKHCKDGQGVEDKNNDNKINFDNPLKTFGPLEYCKTCPYNIVKCNSGRSGGTNGCTAVNGNGKTWKSVFNEMSGNNEKITENITVEMIDRRWPFIKNYSKDLKNSGNSLFKDSYLFKSVRTQEWKCKFNKQKKMNVCKLDNFDEKIDLNEYTTFKVLLIYWLEDFLYGYYILKKRKVFEQCKENGENTCSDEQSKKNCACVKEWVDQKKKEWKNIKQHYNIRKDDKAYNIEYTVKTFLGILIHRMDLVNDKGKISDLDAFLKSYECKCSDNSKSDKDDTPKDIVECLLDKLGEKAKKCEQKHQTSDQTHQTSCENSTPLDEEPDEEDLLLEEENPENKVGHPQICKGVLPEPQPETGKKGDCDAPEEKTKENDQAGAEELKPAADSPPSSTPSADTKSEKEVPPAPAPEELPSPVQPLPSDEPSKPIGDILSSTIPFGIAIALTSIVFLFLKKKTKSTIDLLRVINIPKGDYDIPTKLSPNRYIPYTSGKYRGKRYIYIEGDSGTDSGYTDHYSDITSSSESEYEEMDINDIYVPGSPKYKTLIEVVLEPSGKNTTASGKNTTASGKNTPSDNTPTNKFADNEWNTLKDDFISQYLQSEQPNDVPNDYTSGNSSTNTNITTTSRHNVDNNTNTTMSRDNMEEKPFIMSIHDRDLYTGEEYSYNVNMSTNSMDDIPISGKNTVYSGIDLINDTLSGNAHIDIYDELLKRKENELFGTEHHPKHTTINRVAKPARDDPLHNQLNLFHKWLDRHRDMCEQWNNKEEVLDKLKEEWNKDNNNNSGTPSDNTTPTTGITPPTSDNTPPISDIPSGKLSDTPSDNNIHSDIHPSDIPSGKQSDIPSDNNIHSDIPYVLNTDVSIQIHMDNPKTTNEFTYVDSNPNQVDDTYVDSNPDNSSMDTILDDLDKPFNEPYYYDMYDDDIYYDVNDHDTSTVDTNAMDVPSKVQIEMDVNTKLVKEKYPIADVWDI
ncbi:erythrocyte membrane protein 1 [Plasmodium falciparum IGH-CR14]|uniref:Erythrocyte membrane protein 1 n=1 Tax=Plasmodium falciparum IGH-CR14 TaxID=580059 RepID=A0A0L1I4S0_PLAFA|nr:erythrocyte membrane protein 1 [Plasmodium falciparum IGH-CR14]